MAKDTEQLNGLHYICLERHEQMEKHLYSIAHDVIVNNHGQLVQVAKYLLETDEEYKNLLWPRNWKNEWRKKFDNKTYQERVIIAGALMAAEYDRLQFLKNKTHG